MVGRYYPRFYCRSRPAFFSFLVARHRLQPTTRAFISPPFPRIFLCTVRAPPLFNWLPCFLGRVPLISLWRFVRSPGGGSRLTRSSAPLYQWAKPISVRPCFSFSGPSRSGSFPFSASVLAHPPVPWAEVFVVPHATRGLFEPPAFHFAFCVHRPLYLTLSLLRLCKRIRLSLFIVATILFLPIF